MHQSCCDGSEAVRTRGWMASMQLNASVWLDGDMQLLEKRRFGRCISIA